MKLVVVSSVLLGALACSVLGVKRPDAELAWANTAPGAEGAQWKLTIYNALTDYSESGERLPGAKPQHEVFPSCEEFAAAMNGRLTLDAHAQAELSRFRREAESKIRRLKEACGRQCWGI